MRKSVLYGVENLYIFMPKQLRFKKNRGDRGLFQGIFSSNTICPVEKAAYAG